MWPHFGSVEVVFNVNEIFDLEGTSSWSDPRLDFGEQILRHLAYILPFLSVDQCIESPEPRVIVLGNAVDCSAQCVDQRFDATDILRRDCLHEGEGKPLKVIGAFVGLILFDKPLLLNRSDQSFLALWVVCEELNQLPELNI